MRVERRTLDFMLAVYEDIADDVSYIHDEERKAFDLYCTGYNMETRRFEGSILAVDAAMSEEPHFRGVGARVRLCGLTSVVFNGLKGHIMIVRTPPNQSNCSETG